MTLRLLSALVVASLAALPGCSGADDSLGNDRNPIVRGDVDQGDLQVMALIVSRWDGKTSYCSSVLYAARTLATAAHCLDRAERVLAYFGNDFWGDYAQLFEAQQPNWRRATSWQRHPRYARRGLDADIAVVQLDEDIPIKPMRLHEPRIDRSFIGSAVQIIGYGASTVDAQTGTQAKGHFVKRTGFSRYEGTPRVHRWWPHRHHKGPPRHHLMQLDGSEPNASACRGDDGGPAIMKIDGELRLVGINVWQSSFCNDRSYYVRVSDYVSFLQSNAAPSK